MIRAYGQVYGRFPCRAFALLTLICTAPGIAAQDNPSTSRIRALIHVRPIAENAGEAAVARDHATQVALLKSEKTIRAALERPEMVALSKALMENDEETRGVLVDHLQKRLRTEYEGDILGVSMSAGTAVEQATIINAVVALYLEGQKAEADESLSRLAHRRSTFWALYQNELDRSSDATLVAAARSLSRESLLGRIAECRRRGLELQLREVEVKARVAILKAPEELREEVIEKQRALLGDEIDELEGRLHSIVIGELEQEREQRGKLTNELRARWIAAEIEMRMAEASPPESRITLVQPAQADE